MAVWCEKCGEKRANYRERGRGKPLKRCVKCKEDGMTRASRICIEEGCSKPACFNKNGNKQALYCFKHKKAEMIDVISKKCEFPDCLKQPSYNFEGQTKGKFCSLHKEIGMVDVKSRLCAKKGCGKYPSFNFPGQPVAKFCTTHKETGMINVKDRTCEDSDCDKIPVFNFPGQARGIYCLIHKKSGMVDVKNRVCAVKGCGKVPNFNFRGLNSGKYCAGHKKQKMINVNNRKCAEKGCDTYPFFNSVGETKGKYCAKHKKQGMVNVESNSCEKEGCGKKPSFNIEGESGGRFCKRHKQPGMINVISEKCEKPGCGKIPVFNVKGEIKGRFCSTHKEIDMIDVKNRMCLKQECTFHANHGLLFSRATHCSKHRTVNMFPTTKNYPKCQHPSNSCTIRPFYAAPDSIYPTFCEDHAPEDYINIVEKECEGCLTPFYIPDDQTKCAVCRNVKLIKQKEKSRELRIKSVLKAHNIPLASHDKILEGDCSRRRPDFVIDHPYFTIVVEVDEKQHKDNPGLCDITRMIELHQAFGQNLVFIRYNPDSYTNRAGGRQKGYRQNLKRERRLIALIQQLMRKKKIDQCLSVYYLYYNGDNGIDNLIDLDYGDHLGDFRPLIRKVQAERVGEVWDEDQEDDTEEM